jgi:uncharacterized protein YeaO (DUF488 family)
VIVHGSVYDRDPLAGLRVLIMRRWPRGVRKDHVDVWLKDAAPSTELLDAYHHGQVDWERFEEQYRAEILEQRPAVLDEIRALERDHGTVHLLCHERNARCHRLVLVDMLRKMKGHGGQASSGGARARPAR